MEKSCQDNYTNIEHEFYGRLLKEQKFKCNKDFKLFVWIM